MASTPSLEEDDLHGRALIGGLAAPFVLDGPMGGVAFRPYVREILAPELAPGDVVVMDHLPAHKVRGVRQAIEAAGASPVYLLAYSPDFNPIEVAFSKFKALLRAAAARTIPDLWVAIRIALDTFTPRDCQNYFAAAGYDAILIVRCGRYQLMLARSA